MTVENSVRGFLDRVEAARWSGLVLIAELVASCGPDEDAKPSDSRTSGSADHTGEPATVEERASLESLRGQMRRAGALIADADDAATATKQHAFAARAADILEKLPSQFERGSEDYWQARWMFIHARSRLPVDSRPKDMTSLLEEMIAEDPSQVQALAIVSLVRTLDRSGRRDEANKMAQRVLPLVSDGPSALKYVQHRAER